MLQRPQESRKTTSNDERYGNGRDLSDESETRKDQLYVACNDAKIHADNPRRLLTLFHFSVGFGSFAQSRRSRITYLFIMP